MPYTCLMYPQVTLGKAKLACWVFQSVCVIHVYSAPFKNEDCVCLCCYIDLHSGVCSAINFSWKPKACIAHWVLVNTLNCLFHKHGSQSIILQLKQLFSKQSVAPLQGMQFQLYISSPRWLWRDLSFSRNHCNTIFKTIRFYVGLIS